MAASVALRASGPGVSSVVLSGRMPSVAICPAVVFNPVTPQSAEGVRTDPPVSVPTAHGTSRAATATPEPLLEPPGVHGSRMSHGLRGAPMC